MEQIWLRHYDAGVSSQLRYAQRTLPEMLDAVARQYPRRTATTFVLRYLLGGRLRVGGSLSYARLRALVDRFAAALQRLGVAPGDRVALVLPNTPQYVIAFFGVLKAGAVVVNCNPTYTARELEHQLSDAGAETAIIISQLWPRIEEARRHTPLRRVVVTGLEDGLDWLSRTLARRELRKSEPEIPARADVHRFQDLLGRRGVPEPVAISPTDTALIQYTGGTTGLPKGAMLTHRNLLANAEQCVAWVFPGGVGEAQETFLSAPPFFHVYGLQVGMLSGLTIGGRLAIIPMPRPATVLMDAVQNERCTFFPGVPAMFSGIVGSSEVGRYKLRSVRVGFSGSAPLPSGIMERFDALTGGRLIEGYGMTECSPVSHGNPAAGVRKEGSVGIPFPDTESRVVDVETRADLPFDGVSRGEMLVRGPQVMRGYWRRPEETALVFESGGWLRTGDIVVVDADGYFFVVDRLKDMINVSGFKVLPREVEEVLRRHPGVEDVVVAGVPHPDRGDDTVTAFVVPKAGATLSSGELKKFCGEYLASYKVPRAYRIRDDLPRSYIGKALRRQLVEDELAGAGGPRQQG